jgi:fatty-acyl-CoA synthase
VPVILTAPADAGIDGALQLDDVLRSSSPDEPAVELDERDPHVLLCTSGTTGTAKGVLQSHLAYYLMTSSGFGPAPSCTAEDDIAIVPYQMFHSSGWRAAFGAWRARSTYVSLRHATPLEIFSSIEDERATHFGAVPQVIREVVAWPEADAYDRSTLRIVQTGTSAMTAEEIHRIGEFFGPETLRVSYGASEIGPVATNYGEGLRRNPLSVGIPVPNVEVRVVDAGGSALGAGEVGEILILSGWPMLGYRDDPEQTAAAFTDGWYRTGDLGYLDDESFLFIVGRVRDMIRSGGESIFPVEVEEALRQHPAVADCGAVGIPDERWGESVAVGVVLEDGHEVAEDEIQEFLRARLAGYKVPRVVRFVDQIPRVEATAKVARPRLRELIVNSGSPAS